MNQRGPHLHGPVPTSAEVNLEHGCPCPKQGTLASPPLQPVSEMCVKSIYMYMYMNVTVTWRASTSTCVYV